MERVLKKVLLPAVLAAAAAAFWARPALERALTPLVEPPEIQRALEEDRPAKAARLAERRLEEFPEEAATLYLHATALYRTGDVDGALESLAAAEKRLAGKSDEASRGLKKAIWSLAGEIHLDYTKDYRKAVRALERLKSADPEDWDARYRLGTAYAYAGMSASAYKEFSEIIAAKPGSDAAKYAENAIQYVRERRNPGKSEYVTL